MPRNRVVPKGLSVIIPVWNGRAHLEENLPSVLEAVQRVEVPWEVLVVDDASTDGSAEFLEENHPMVQVVRRVHNEGFHAAISTGEAKARYSVLYFLNCDVCVEPDTFRSVIPHFSDEKVFAVASLDVGPEQVFVPAFTFRWGLLGVRYLPVPEPKAPMSLLFATGGHSAYDTAKFRAMEGFDILYSPFYWEDIDLCTRAQARGWRVLLEPASRVSHVPGSSVARRHSQRRIAFWRADHRFLFTLRHSPSVGILTLFMFVASHGWSALLSLFRLVGRVKQIKRDSKESASVLKHHSLPAVKRAHGDPWTVAYLSFYGDIAGGGEISLLHLVQALDRQRVRPILLCPQEGELSRKFRDLGAEVHLVLFPHTLWGVLNGTVLRLARWMSNTGVDVVHVNTAGRMLFLSGLAARCLGIPVVWHARVADREPLADRLATRLVDRIIATSQYVAGRFQWGKVKSKVVCIPNPIDLSRFQPNPDGKEWREQNGLPVHSILVGIFGRLDAWKRFDLALRAAALARAKQESLHFLVVGKGPERRSLERLARDLDLKKSLSFLDWQDDVTKAMSSIDILLHPTPGEHFGRVYIEAMACGKPVVAADSGGAREIVLSEQTGILVPPNDPGPLAEALVRLAANETLCQSMGRAGRRRAETLFDARRVAGLVENLYDDILIQ